MLVDLGSGCVFSRVRLCLVFFVRESPPLWRGFVTELHWLGSLRWSSLTEFDPKSVADFVSNDL